MAAYVSLFRAINVGGYQVKMDALKELHRGLGFDNVNTLLQTGNVVFDTAETSPSKLAGKIQSAFAEKFGFTSQVMVRTAAEIDHIFSHNPFSKQPERETKWIVVMFLSDTPPENGLPDLLSSYKGPEEMHLAGKELYMYYPNGIGESKLTTALIEKKLKVAGTGRNWNTFSKLKDLLNR